MSSPFYPYPSPASLPSPLSSLLPSIAQQTSGLALTPGTNPFLYPIPNQQLLPNQSISSLHGPSGTGSQGGGGTSVRSGNVRREDVTLEDTLRGLAEGMSLVDRGKAVLEEIGRLQAGVFGSEVDTGRLDLLQIEYNQTINTLYLLAQSSSFGALPLLPSSSSTINSNLNLTDSTTIPTSDAMPSTAVVNSSSRTDKSLSTTDTPELIAWCETRAGLEFSRREGVKNGSKVVLDILKAR